VKSKLFIPLRRYTKYNPGCYPATRCYVRLGLHRSAKIFAGFTKRPLTINQPIVICQLDRSNANIFGFIFDVALLMLAFWPIKLIFVKIWEIFSMRTFSKKCGEKLINRQMTNI